MNSSLPTVIPTTDTPTPDHYNPLCEVVYTTTLTPEEEYPETHRTEDLSTAHPFRRLIKANVKGENPDFAALVKLRAEMVSNPDLDCAEIVIEQIDSVLKASPQT